MDIWTSNKLEKLLPNNDSRAGLRLRIDKDVNEDVKQSIKRFAKWLRTKYKFPIRLPVYVKSDSFVKTRDGDFVVGSFFEPEKYTVEPFIRISTGDYDELVSLIGRDSAIASLLHTLSHEITHYYQWINGLEMTINVREQQAEYYADLIIDRYSMVVEHP
jgi:hypothetical protein